MTDSKGRQHENRGLPFETLRYAMLIWLRSCRSKDGQRDTMP